MNKHNKNVVLSLAGLLLCGPAHAEITGSGPRLQEGDRIRQEEITSGALSLAEIRKAGLTIFSTPFNKADGFGDGPHDTAIPDKRDPAEGNRPTLQGNNTFLRVNGLDSQTCLECHSIVSNAEVPARFGVGGFGGINNSAIFQPTLIGVADTDFDGIAEFDGRLINPPFLFGAGGVELLAREMTADLQKLKQQALANPGVPIALITKNVSFGEVTANESGILDTSTVEGVDTDLVVRPFGRKGEFASVREFSVVAMTFHLGMQAAEAFGGEFADNDYDGVSNEISVGDLSALSIFVTSMDSPYQEKPDKKSMDGLRLFTEIGCADCHRPVLNTHSRHLHYKLTGSPQQPLADTFYSVDLTLPPMTFAKAEQEGVSVALFSDLKRHAMGAVLEESFSKATAERNAQFITARLWGVADSAPYLHDGRALTLVEAIALHDGPGSEASSAAQAFATLGDEDKDLVIRFLKSLRTPRDPNSDVIDREETRGKRRRKD